MPRTTWWRSSAGSRWDRRNVVSGESRAPDDLVGGLSGALLVLPLRSAQFSLIDTLQSRPTKKAPGGSRQDIGSRRCPELVNVAAGLFDADRYLQAAVATARAGSALPAADDLSDIEPRATPFIDALGTLLSLLDQRQIDVLATLRSNLTQTRSQMTAVTSGRRSLAC